MYSYNITFIVEPNQEERLLNYIRCDLTDRLFPIQSTAEGIVLQKVVEVGGEKPGNEDALSIAMAVSFPTEEDAYHWHDHTLLPALADFQNIFGNNSLFFITLLEKIPL